jgi:hypothetical protein
MTSTHQDLEKYERLRKAVPGLTAEEAIHVLSRQGRDS